MSVSTRVRYAVRLMAGIARHSSQGEAVSPREVAARQGMSEHGGSKLEGIVGIPASRTLEDLIGGRTGAAMRGQDHEKKHSHCG